MTTPSTYKLGYPPLKYSTVPFAGAYARDPTTADINNPTVGGTYKYGSMWVNTSTNGVWIFTGVVANAAQWQGITDPATGNVDGPASATDNAIARFDGTTGKLIQNSVGILSDTGFLSQVRPLLPAGTTTLLPMRFTSGVNLTIPQDGAMEYDGTKLTYTDSTLTRRPIVTGPASSTDNALMRWDSTSGTLSKNSVGLLGDTGILTGLTSVGIGIAPTAYLGLAAGTATAGTAPIKFATGVNLTIAEAGAVEYDGTLLTYTDSVPTRNILAVGPGASTSNGLASWSSNTGYKLLSSTTTLASDVITFPANGGNVLTVGSRKGTFTLTGGASGDITTAAALTGSVICVTVTALGTVAAAQAMRVTITDGVKFVINSADGTDTSSGTWAIVG